MTEDQTSARVIGGTLRIRARGPADGQRMLFLHGGPGLSDVYLDGLIDEFADTYRVATYAQRGVAPSTAAEPFDLDVQAADAIAVLDALNWSDALLIGHSWGGHLLLHALAARTGRLSAAVAIDPIGIGGGGGEVETFAEELVGRLSPEARARGEQPDLTDDEQFAVNWPGYFPPGSAVPPFTPISSSSETFAASIEAMFAALPALTERLRGVATPTLFIIGTGSPLPETASVNTAAVIGNAAVIARVPGGHFPWLMQPGAVRLAVDAFLSTLR